VVFKAKAKDLEAKVETIAMKDQSSRPMDLHKRRGIHRLSDSLQQQPWLSL